MKHENCICENGPKKFHLVAKEKTKEYLSCHHGTDHKKNRFRLQISLNLMILELTSINRKQRVNQ